MTFKMLLECLVAVHHYTQEQADELGRNEEVLKHKVPLTGVDLISYLDSMVTHWSGR